jgi:HAD superfamily hydrolase (TIGR01509 family)
MPIKAVIFDLDGTLATFNLDYKTVRAEVRAYLFKNGVPASLLSLNENIFEMLKKTELFLKHQGKPDEAVSEIRRTALKIAEKYELEAAEQTNLLSGAVETLKALKRTDLKIGLCTINSEKSMDYILKRFQITEYFNAKVPRDKVNYTKPHPEHLKTTLKALNAAPKETLVIGDSVSDMQAANEIKAIAVGLPTGVSTSEQLISQGANYIITSITDIPTLVQTINKAETARTETAKETSQTF